MSYSENKKGLLDGEILVYDSIGLVQFSANFSNGKTIGTSLMYDSALYLRVEKYDSANLDFFYYNSNILDSYDRVRNGIKEYRVTYSDGCDIQINDTIKMGIYFKPASKKLTVKFLKTKYPINEPSPSNRW